MPLARRRQEKRRRDFFIVSEQGKTERCDTKVLSSRDCKTKAVLLSGTRRGTRSMGRKNVLGPLLAGKTEATGNLQ